MERNRGGNKYGSRLLPIAGAQAEQLFGYVREQRVTVNTLVQGVWSYLLHRYTGREEVVYGVVVSGRPAELSEVEGRVGLYINTLPLRTRLAGERQVGDWLRGLQAEQLGSREYQYPSLRRVQGWSEVRGDWFDSLLVYENYPVQRLQERGSSGLRVNGLRVNEETNYALTLLVTESDRLQVQFNYNAGLLSPAEVERMAGHFEEVLEQIVTHPSMRVEELRLLSEGEERQLMTEFQGPVVDYGADRTLPGMFLRQARWHGSRVALVYRGREWTYKEVDELSNQLGNYLQKEYGIGREELVGVLLGRGEWQVISLLAVLKTGAAYVPVDPAYPAERVAYLRQDGGWRVCLDESEIAKFLSVQEQYLPEEPGVTVSGEQLAYVLYTSGSTGRPKGCMLEHRGVVNRLEWMWREYGMTEEEVFLQKTTFTFDVSVWELFLPLCWGGKLVLCEQEDIHSPQRLAELIGRYGVSCIHFVPSMLGVFLGEVFGSDHLMQQLSSLKRVMASGEALGTSLVDRWYQGMPTIPLYNLYGPTEASIDVSHYETGAGMSTVPIGRPVANTRLYVVDGQGRLSPVGVPGELWISGVQVARGYWNREELTAEKFINDPFAEGSRVYRTGDRARWLADGNIEYLGRIDEQVKVRGYRIEPGEIEGAVLQSGLVQQVAVAVWQERLVGYVVGEAFDQVKLVAHLGSRLPEYMVPQLWVELDALPLTASGKTDRKQLPEPSVSGDSYTAPRTETEAELAAIWQEVLNIERVGVSDNFFALGGHSLLAIRILGRINSQWKIKIGLAELFSSPTVTALASRIGRSAAVVTEAIPVAQIMEHYPVSGGQLRLWVLQQLYPGNYSYNIVHQYRYAGVLEPERLQHALDQLIERHEILRTRFVEVDGEPRQVILPTSEGRVIIGWSTQTAAEVVRQESRHVFDLTTGPLLRVQVVPTAEDVHKLVVNIHHIITDEWSMEVMLREWTEAYEGAVQRSPLRIQYKDYAVWEQEQLARGRLENMRQFWMDQFAGQEPVAELPADRRRPLEADLSGETIGYRFPGSLQKSLRRLATEREVSMYMLLLSLTEVLLYNYTGESRVVIGTPTMGRDHADLEGQIGFYVNTLAMVGEVKGEETFLSLLERTKGQVLRCYEHQGYPFDRLVSELNITREVNRNPLFDVMITYHQTEGHANAEEKIAGIFSFTGEDGTASKFDCRLVLIDTTQGLQLQLNYRTSLFDRSRMERMIGHLERLAEQVVADPQSIVGSLSLLSPQEQERLLTLGQSEAAYPRNKSVVALWREQVGHTPLATALVYGDERLSYQEVDRWSSRVAGWLADQRLLPEERVAVVMDRTIRSIVAILAVLKAGGAFVPLDPAWPQERKLFLLEDAGCRLVLGGEALPESSTEVEDVSGPGNLAYVIYTSGSTGRPKGVLVEQEALIDHIYGGIARMGLDNCRRYGLVSSLVADGNHSMLFSALLTGAELHVLPEELVLDGDRLSGYLQEQQIDCVKMVPSHWLSCGEAGSYPLPGKVLILGGEAFPAGILDRLRAWDYKGKVFNHYGPTEVTIGKSVHEVDLARKYDRVPIGRPFANGRLYILDGAGRLSPTGIPGELHVGGAGLARGYLNREELTAEKFVTDPFVWGGRMYKTGDICRWTAEGEIEYIGRIDEQVKVRGYRIEPGEIEGVVSQSGLVQQVVVVIWQGRLVGYVVAEEFDQAKISGLSECSVAGVSDPETMDAAGVDAADG